MTITITTNVGTKTFRSSEYAYQQYLRNPTPRRTANLLFKHTDMTKAQARAFLSGGYSVSARP